MSTTAKKYVVDGHWGPPWPRGLFGVQEPVETSIGRTCSSSRAVTGKENPCGPSLSETSAPNIHDRSYKPNISTKGDGISGREHELKRPRDSGVQDSVAEVYIKQIKVEARGSNEDARPHYNRGEPAMKPPNKMSRFGGVMRKKPLDFIQSSKVGHRMSNGKVTSIPLTMTNKAYKKPQQLSLKKYMK